MRTTAFLTGVCLAAFLFLCTPVLAAGVLVPRDGSRAIEVKSQQVTVDLEQGLARTTVRQTFVNPHSRPLEAIYVFPVPPDAALIDVAMELNGVRMSGILVERQRGRRIYTEIVHRQEDPALVEQVGTGAFRLSVFPVVPRKDTVVELTWIQQVPLRNGAYRYVYPLALAGSTTKTKQKFSFTLSAKSALGLVTVESPMTDMTIERKAPDEFVAAFAQDQAALDQDIVVTASVLASGAELTARSFRRATGDGWFEILVTPPKPDPKGALPRDIVLVLDTSRSMKGVKIEELRRAALSLLARLSPEDRLQIVSFGTGVIRPTPTLLPVTEEHRADGGIKCC
jgi:Ca-activated chloride channel homolog